MKPALLGTALAAALLVAPAPVVAAPAPVHRTAALEAAITPGSYLTVVEKGRSFPDGGFAARTQRLVLVSPTGEQRTVYSRRVRHHLTFLLADWSVDGATALLSVPGPTGGSLLRIDVATGAVVQAIDVPLLNNAILDPAGTGVIVTRFKSERSSTLGLVSISWAGVVTRLRNRVTGQLVAGPPGTVLTADGKRGRQQLLLSTTTGAVVNQFRGKGYCSPVRWWDATHVLETCSDSYDLYLVDPSAGTVSRLTKGHGRGDYGHLDARAVGSDLYVQVAGACGYTYVAKVTHGSTRPIKVDGAVGNVVMVNVVGGSLVLEHAASCDGAAPRSVLATWDPVTHTESRLVKLARDEDFGAVRVLGEVHASIY
jgi:hypothetical protein